MKAYNIQVNHPNWIEYWIPCDTLADALWVIASIKGDVRLFNYQSEIDLSLFDGTIKMFEMEREREAG